MWDLPGPGIEPVSPTLAGRFLTTASPGKSPHTLLVLQTMVGHVSLVICLKNNRFGLEALEDAIDLASVIPSAQKELG